MNILFYFLVPLFTGIIATFLLTKFSEKTHFLVDVSEGDVLKIHKKNIPLLGGLAMLVAWLAGAILVWRPGFHWYIITITAGPLMVFLLGFYDDLNWKHISTTKPMQKFILLLLCALIGSAVLLFAGISFRFLPYYAISLFLGFAYIFVCINAVNYQDGMDGLAGGLAIISFLGFSLLSVVAYNGFTLMISIIALGGVTAFLCFNFPPAKIFMGDSGAYLLGFILTLDAMMFSKPYNIFSIIGPVFIIGLPIFDGVFTNIRRLATRKSIFLGDRSHMYDKFLQKGYSTRKTLAMCYALQIVLVIAGVVIYKL